MNAIRPFNECIFNRCCSLIESKGDLRATGRSERGEGREESVHESSYRETRDKGSVHQVLLRSQWP